MEIFLNQMRKAKPMYSEFAIKIGRSLAFWQRLKGRESFREEKGEGFRCTLIQSCLLQEALGELIRSGASYAIWLGVPIAPSKLEVGTKIREDSSYSSGFSD